MQMSSTITAANRARPLSDVRARQLRDILARRARIRGAVAVARLVAGFPLCFLAPLFLGSVFWLISAQFLGWHPWWWFFAGFSLLTIPLLFRMELRTGGDYLGDVARHGGPEVPGGEFLAGAGWAIGGGMGMVAGNAVAAPRTAAAGFVEFFLIGPRMMVRGARHLRHAGQFKKVSMDRVVTLIWQLLVHEQGVLLVSLATLREDRADVAGALAWLAFYDWIGVGEKGAKAFLFGESRKYLTARLGELSG
jgi:hypothetical protein